MGWLKAAEYPDGSGYGWCWKPHKKWLVYLNLYWRWGVKVSLGEYTAIECLFFDVEATYNSHGWL